MVDISSKAKLEAWLEDQPQEVSAVIAARAAWRVVVRTHQWLKTDIDRAELFYPILNGIAKSIVFVGNLEGRKRQNNITSNASNKYILDNENRYTKITKASSALHMAASACNALNSSYASSAALNVFWLHSSKRGSVLVDAGKNDALEYLRGASVQRIIGSPLWPNETPPWFLEDYDLFVKNCVEAQENLEVWLEWLAAIVKGGPRPHDAAFARAVNDLELWKRPPAEINAQIRAWVDEAKANWQPEVEPPPPEPDPQPGTQFAVTPQGFDPSGSAPHLRENVSHEQQQRLYDSLQRRLNRIEAVAPRFRNTNPILHDEYLDYMQIAVQPLADLNVEGLWSVGAALSDMIEGVETRFDRATKEQKASALLELPDGEVCKLLGALARDHAAFVMGYQEAVDLAARAASLRQLGLQPKEQAPRLKAVLSPMLNTAGLLAERGKVLVGALDRAIDVIDDKAVATMGAATSAATNSVIAYGKAIVPVVSVLSMTAGAPLDIMMKLSGDPNWEALRAAMIYLHNNADALAGFAANDVTLRMWLSWLIERIKDGAAKINL